MIETDLESLIWIGITPKERSLKITFWSANYSACVVYTKTIIHLNVGESGGYLPSREARGKHPSFL